MISPADLAPYAERSSSLRRYAVSLTHDPDAASDLVQDTLMRALTHLHLFEEGTDLRAWLFTILHNQYVNEVRRGVRQSNAICLDPEGTPMLQSTIHVNPTARLELQQTASHLQQLPRQQQRVILAAATLGNTEKSYDAIAEFEQVPVGTVRSRLSRGRAMIRALAQGIELSADEEALL